MSHEIMSWVTWDAYGGRCSCGARFESTDNDVISTQIAQHQEDA